MFEQIFKNIDDVLWKEAGCATELDYTRSGRATTRVRQLPADRVRASGCVHADVE